MKQVLFGILALTLLPFAHAKDAAPLADDPALEARLLKLSEELRCLVCQNQSLADSHSDLAGDLRKEVREMMKQGKTDKEVVDHLVQRYGDFVRYRPPMKSSTYLLWFGPLLLLAIGGGVLVYTLKQRRKQIVDHMLTDDERARVDALLHNEDGMKS